MKNLTRILALVLVFTMMVSSAAFAAKFTDVAEDSTYAEAVEVLSALGILNGYEDGTFKPDAVITRAEVVAVVNRLQGLSDAAKAAAGTSMYTDVATTDWFAGDVNLASQMGIVSGDGNGLFRPNDQVKYEEAVKMMVAALGYNHEYVMKQGGWPTGYLVIATQAEVTKGLSVSAGEPAHRGIVAKLAYQSLVAPMMVLASYDDDGKATYRPDATKTLLGTKLGFAKVVGFVNTNEVSSLTSTSQTDKGYISYTFDNSVVVESSTSSQHGYKYYVGNRDVADFNASGVMNNINVGETDVADTLGLATEIYLGLNDDDEAEVLTYIVSKKNNATAEIAKAIDIQTSGKYDSDINEVVEDSDVVAITGTISVYDEEVDTTNTEYKLDNAQIIFNGSWVDPDNWDAALPNSLGTYLIPVQGKLELLDNDGDGKYEFVFVTSYETRVVDSIYGGNKKIGMKVGSTIDLTNFLEEKDGYTYSITLDGEEIAITDLQEYDVLSVAATGMNTTTAKYIEIIVSRNVVEGAIESIDPHTNKLKEIYTIAGADYQIANIAGINTATGLGITSSTEGKFFIDAFGKIAMTEADNAISGNLAYIQGIGDYQSMGQTEYEMEVLNKDGSVVVYNFADTVTVKENNVSKKIVAGALTNSTDKSAKADVANYIINTVLAAETEASATAAKRVITYRANANGKITAITFGANAAAEGLSYVDGNATVSSDAAQDKYDASVNALGAYGVTDSTVIFYVPANKTKDDYKVADISMLVDEKKYDVAYLDIDDDVNAGVLVITSDSISIADGSALAIVLGSIVKTNEEGDRVLSVTFLQNGEEKTLDVDAEAAINDPDAVNPVFPRGAVFEYSVNSEGFIDDAKFCGLSQTDVLTWQEVKAAAGSIATKWSSSADYANGGFQYIGGYVVAKNGSTLTLANAFDAASGDRVAIPSTANVYTMDVTKTKIQPKATAIGDVVALKYYKQFYTDNTYATVSNTQTSFYDAIAEEEADTFVLIKYVDKEIVDVIAYYGFAPTARY